MIDPATGWFEVKETAVRSSNVAANIVEQTWLTRYPWPQKVILDRGTEFMKDFITIVWDEYRTKHKPITTRNPQLNCIVERTHQTIGNLLCTFKPGSVELDPEDPWSSILSTLMLALRSMIHDPQCYSHTTCIWEGYNAKCHTSSQLAVHTRMSATFN
eukprot:5365636-Ditylum_brightwellii.AAC.3